MTLEKPLVHPGLSAEANRFDTGLYYAGLHWIHSGIDLRGEHFIQGETQSNPRDTVAALNKIPGILASTRALHSRRGPHKVDFDAGLGRGIPLVTSLFRLGVKAKRIPKIKRGSDRVRVLMGYPLSEEKFGKKPVENDAIIYVKSTTPETTRLLKELSDYRKYQDALLRKKAYDHLGPLFISLRKHLGRDYFGHFHNIGWHPLELFSEELSPESATHLFNEINASKLGAHIRLAVVKGLHDQELHYFLVGKTWLGVEIAQQADAYFKKQLNRGNTIWHFELKPNLASPKTVFAIPDDRGQNIYAEEKELPT